ncbi:MAG TPA: hypothetical protein VK603_05875 [Candidatus Saccharimonadales bacterium]|nr:hypothetical protein [Candidatus Saccharimonadales bacterium]
MESLTLTYRDDDRMPLILAIRAMARRINNLDVGIAKITGGDEYEAALFDGAAHVIIEHLEYLYDEAAKGKKTIIFCAPSKDGGLDLVVPQHISSVAQFKRH